VVSHSEFIQELITSGRLNVPQDATRPPEGYAYHDPCYLGRYNQVYEAPRQVLLQIEGSYKELPRHHDRGFCCGAGGARAFMEEKRGSRISHNRLNEALGEDVAGMAVACPFCITMFEDGAKGLNVDETFAVKDVAELVALAIDQKRAAAV
jgi:Fe-S oxidoreductase